MYRDREESAKIWIAIIVVALIVVFFVISLFQGGEDCMETIGNRPCISGTIEYDWDDGECECLTEFGELEWNTRGGGCDMD